MLNQNFNQTLETLLSYPNHVKSHTCSLQCLAIRTSDDKAMYVAYTATDTTDIILRNK